MIDINEVLRQAAEVARRAAPNPAWDRHVEAVKRFSAPPLDMRRRPDGVWELPE